MEIDISNNKITIDDSSFSLKPRHASQLQFWEFAKVPGLNKYELSSMKVDIITTKIIKYFEKEGVYYSLTPCSKNYLSELQKTVDRNKSIRIAGKEYKDGKFDNSKYTEFFTFVKKNIRRSLKEHQLKAAFHLYLVENGANFSVPGSGKTAVVLTVYERLKIENKVNLLYVVGPPACFGPWRIEFKLTLGRDPDSRILAGGEQGQRRLEYYSPASQKAELYLTTFQTLLNDQEELKMFLNHQDNKTFLVIDEAHYIKQIGGSWASTVLRIAEYAKYRCILTGTPMPRSYTDVFNLFDFLWPNDSPLDSDKKFQIKIQEENNNIQLAKDIINKNIGPLFYRVRKSELGLIPPVFHPPISIPMNKYENIIYEAIERRIISYSRQDYLKDYDFVKKLRRGRIIRLRQCVSYVKLLTTAIDDYEENMIYGQSDLIKIISGYDKLETPAKLEKLKELIQDLQNRKQKVVIWSHFIGTLKYIVSYLATAGFYCKLIYGDTPIEQTSLSEEETREKIRNEFVDADSGLDILVANPAACGESISLHKTCYHSVYYDLSYNCAQYLQSLDRIHRVGGSEVNQANYYFLQYVNTIDQDIVHNLDNKARKMYDVIEEDYGIYSLDMFEEDEDIQAYERLFYKE